MQDSLIERVLTEEQALDRYSPSLKTRKAWLSGRRAHFSEGLNTQEQPCETVSLNSYQSLAGPPEALDEVKEELRGFLTEAIRCQGLKALDCPRSAAIAHEAGHTVTCASFGEEVRSTRIWRVHVDAYSGETKWGSEWEVTESTRPEQDFKIACCLMAGVLGEMILDSRNFRLASSADEAMNARIIASRIDEKLGWQAGDAAGRILWSTTSALKTNDTIARAVCDELDRTESIEQPRLHELLCSIKPRAWMLDFGGRW